MKIKEIVVVEGKYDAMAVKRACDATVIETSGFGVFKNKETSSFIAKMAKERGIIILTDSDKAGFVIRRHIQSVVDKKYIKNAYIPTIEGKEKRKITPSKEGSLGVEGMDNNVIINALIRAGATVDDEEKKSLDKLITKADLYEDGLTGGQNSIEKKRKLLKYLELPLSLSTKKLLESINIFLSYDEYRDIIDKINN